MGKVGLEPTRIAPRDPKSRSSASSDTPPLLQYYSRKLPVFQLPTPESGQNVPWPVDTACDTAPMTACLDPPKAARFARYSPTPDVGEEVAEDAVLAAVVYLVPLAR